MNFNFRLRLKNRYADFLHDRFKARRDWSSETGWTFRFGPFVVRDPTCRPVKRKSDGPTQQP